MFFSVPVHKYFKPTWSPAVHLYNSTSVHVHSLPLGLESVEWLCKSMIVGCGCGKLERVASQWDCLVEHLLVRSWDLLAFRIRIFALQPACTLTVCAVGLMLVLLWWWRGEPDSCLNVFLGAMLVWILEVGIMFPPSLPLNFLVF